MSDAKNSGAGPAVSVDRAAPGSGAGGRAAEAVEETEYEEKLEDEDEEEEDDEEEGPEAKNLLPAKYASASSTDLSATVKDGEDNAFTFELTD